MAIETLKDRTALITGAAVRIGRDLAFTLAHHGVNVVIHYNQSEQHASELKKELQDTGIKSWIIHSDFSRDVDYGVFFEKVLGMTGTLDILINNASIFPKADLEDLTLEQVTENFAINTWAPFALSRAFTTAVRRGNIINMLDQRAFSHDWTHIGYILSKQMLVKLTEMMAIRYAPGFRINGIAPGLILPPPGEQMSYIEKLAHTVPLKAHGDPSDISHAAVFLLSSTFVTGEVIFVDGGRHLVEYVQ